MSPLAPPRRVPSGRRAGSTGSPTSTPVPTAQRAEQSNAGAGSFARQAVAPARSLSERLEVGRRRPFAERSEPALSPGSGPIGVAWPSTPQPAPYGHPRAAPPNTARPGFQEVGRRV